MNTDPFLKQMIKAVQDRRGATGAIMASDFHKYQWGVPIPHLMMEYLFGLNVIPHPCIIELAGLPRSCKSAFLQALLRLFAEKSYGAIMIETEGKMSSTLLASFLEEYLSQVAIVPGPLLQEEWQTEMLSTLKLYRKFYVDSLKAYEKAQKAKKSTDGIMVSPLLLCLDSLGGSPSQSSVDTVNKVGSADRAFPVEALKNKIFFEQLPTRIRDLPLTLVYTNHEKPEGMGETKTFGPPAPKERKTKGGVTPDFFCGLRIFFEQATKVQEVGGRFRQNLNLEVCKNSFNRSGTRIQLTMEWTTAIDTATNELTQHTQFLWNKALAQWLAPSYDGYNYDREAVKKFLTVTRTSDVKYSCKELKLTDVPPEVIGDAIEANAEIKNKLRPYMGIKTWNTWAGHPFSVNVTEDVDLPDPQDVQSQEPFQLDDPPEKPEPNTP